jgi:hypothetical protein
MKTATGASRFMSSAQVGTMGLNLARGATTAGAGVLTRALGFLGGPWGIAITTLATVGIPLLMRAINRNTDALDQNTDMTGENNSRLLLSFMANELNDNHNTYIRRLYKYNAGEDNGVDFHTNQRLLHYKQNFSQWEGKPFYDYSQSGELNIYINGKLDKTIIDKRINKSINTSIQFE